MLLRSFLKAKQKFQIWYKFFFYNLLVLHTFWLKFHIIYYFYNPQESGKHWKEKVRDINEFHLNDSDIWDKIMDPERKHLPLVSVYLGSKLSSLLKL